MSLPEFHQTFEAAAAQTSGLLKQVLSPQTIFFFGEHPFIYKQVVMSPLY